MDVHLRDGLMRVRCPFCNAYEILKLEALDTTAPVYITHKDGCSLDAHIHNPAMLDCPMDAVLKLCADSNEIAADIAKAERS